MERLHAHDINKRIEYLNQLVIQKEKAIKAAPAGYIKIHNVDSGCYIHYYKSRYSESDDVRYLRLNDKRDMGLARAVAQRGYDEKILKRAGKELKMLQKEQDFYAKGCVDEIYDSFNPNRQALITPIRMTDEEYVEKWLSRPYSKKGFREGAPVFDTKRGDRVRSKSEMEISNTLFGEDVPYLYEYPVQLIDCSTGQPYIAHPDFTVLNVRERKRFLWEHFGKMDDPEYAQRNVKKLEDYVNTGFYPGENMIVTFETSSFPLAPKEIKRVVAHYLK